MRCSLVLLFLWVIAASEARADEKTHLAAAEKVVEISRAQAAMKAGFKATLGPTMTTMRSQGAPESALIEMEQVINKWFDDEIKWSDLKPKIVQLYRNKFTEGELKDIIAFYSSPTGQKALEQMPSVLKESAVISNTYVQSKQQSLTAQLQPVLEKYKSKK